MEESWDGPTALGTLLGQKPKPRANHELVRDQHPSLLPLPNSTQEFTLLCCLLTGHNPGELQLPNLTPVPVTCIS